MSINDFHAAPRQEKPSPAGAPDTRQEATFDAIACAASRICDTPSAFIFFISGQQHWIKAQFCVGQLIESTSQFDWCGHTVAREEPLVIGDMADDPRCRASGISTQASGMRAGAGVRIVLRDGTIAGALCVVDRRARRFPDQAIVVLQDLARAIAGEIDSRSEAKAAHLVEQGAVQHELRLARHLALVAQHSDDAIMGFTLDGIVTSWNLAAERMFGYCAAEMVGNQINALIPPEHHGERDAMQARLIRGEAVQAMETVRLHRDGTDVHVSISLSPIRDARGEIIGISKVARDITHQRNQTRLLQESESRYRALVEDQTDMLALALPNGEIKFVNPAFARFFGRTVETLAGTDLWWLVAPEDRFAVMEDLERAASSTEPVHAENRWAAANGEARWVSWTHRSLRDDQHRIFAVHSVGRDVTARRAAEQALEDNQARLKKFYEATPGMLHSSDSQGRLLTVSDVWLLKLGYMRAEVIGRPFMEFFAQCRGDSADLQLAWSRLAEEHRIDEIECQMIRQDGSLIDVRLSMILEVTESGQPAHSLAVIQDVTEQRLAEAELVRHRERLAVATASNDIGVWELDVRTGALSWSDRMFALLDADPKTFSGRYEDSRRYVEEQDFGDAEIRLLAAITRCEPLTLDFRTSNSGGRQKHLHAKATVFTDANGSPSRVVGICYDLTERVRIERELARKHELLHVTLKSIGDAVITTDPVGHVDWLNPVAERMTGWLCAEAKGRPLAQVFRVVNQHTRAPACDAVNRCLVEGHAVALEPDTLLLARDGSEFGIEDGASPIRDADGSIVGSVLVFRDVSEQRRRSSEMAYRARHDELTGLANRSEFVTQLTAGLEAVRHRGDQHAMMFIDLDHFKLVNDACGHAAGDELLKQMAALLQRHLRPGDVLARLGGDEFGAFLPVCSAEQAMHIGETICGHMKDFRFVHEDRRFTLGTSIGLVSIDKRWTNIAGPLQAADSACYSAKAGGRNRVHVWLDTDQAMRNRAGQTQWASRLEQALDEDHFELFGELVAPIGEDGGVRPSHLEIHLRLRDPDGSLELPAAFMPAAERFHKASRIDRWAIRHALEWLARETHCTTPEFVIIKLSGQSVADVGFRDFVAEQCLLFGTAANRLCFAIAEAAATSNIVGTAEFIAAMRQSGIRTALDDFGTGTSSFGYLKNLPVDLLRIDGDLVRELGSDPLAPVAVRFLTEVARTVGMRTVAKCVANADVLARVRGAGVDFAQGLAIQAPASLTQSSASPAHRMPAWKIAA